MLTPYQNVIEKLKNLKTFEGPRQLRWRRKRTEEGRINYFQNKCVSSQKGRIKKRRGRHCSGVTYLLRGETVRAGLVRAEQAAILHGDSTGKTHKIPQMSY